MPIYDVNHIDEHIAKSVLEFYVYQDLIGYVLDRPDIQFNFDNKPPTRRGKCDIGVECVRIGDEKYCHFQNDANKLQLGVKTFLDKDIVELYKPRSIGALKLLHFKDKSSFSSLIANLRRNMYNKKRKCDNLEKKYKGYKHRAREVNLFITLYYEANSRELKQVIKEICYINDKTFRKVFLFVFPDSVLLELSGDKVIDYKMNEDEKFEIINNTITNFSHYPYLKKRKRVK